MAGRLNNSCSEEEVHSRLSHRVWVTLGDNKSEAKYWLVNEFCMCPKSSAWIVWIRHERTNATASQSQPAILDTRWQVPTKHAISICTCQGDDTKV